MNESYLTGEPYLLPKATGAAVLSGAINGDGALTIREEKAAVDSRYAKIMQVMRDSEQRRPQFRRLGDQIGAVYRGIWAGWSSRRRYAAGDRHRHCRLGHQHDCAGHLIRNGNQQRVPLQ